MNKDQKVRVGISIGDLNGIGAEVVIKTFSEVMMFDFCRIVFDVFRLVIFIRICLTRPITAQLCYGLTVTVDVFSKSLFHLLITS